MIRCHIKIKWYNHFFLNRRGLSWMLHNKYYLDHDLHCICKRTMNMKGSKTEPVPNNRVKTH